MKKPKPLWPLTFVRAARWLGTTPRTVSKATGGKPVTFDTFCSLIHQGVGNARERWVTVGAHEVARQHNKSRVIASRLGLITVASRDLHLLRQDFYGIEGRRTPLDFTAIAKLRGISLLDVEAAIAFPW